MSRACMQRRYAQYNIYVEFVCDMIYKSNTVPRKEEKPPFMLPFLDCFPQGSIDTQSVDELVFGRQDMQDKQVFEFKVSLGRKCYRIIRCSPSHTFEDLHFAIQNAFAFDDDHLYSFYLDGKNHSNHAIHSPHSQQQPYSSEVCLRDGRLKDKQRLLYLFDYGDCWMFDITVDIRSEAAGTMKQPQIIKTVGEAPEQYPF